MKGSALASRLQWVRLNHGEAGVNRLAAAVSPDLRARVEQGVVMARWYPFDHFVELNLAIDRVYGHGDQTLVRLLGRHGADANLTTIYRLFFKVGTVKWVLGRASRLWNLHYDSGHMVVRSLGPRQVEFEVVDFATPHRAHCLSVMGWAERSVELSGGRDVTTTEVSCRALGAERCVFRLAWD